MRATPALQFVTSSSCILAPSRSNLSTCNGQPFCSCTVTASQHLYPFNAAPIDVAVQYCCHLLLRRYGLAIGYYCSWLVRALMLLTSPISWPLGKLLDVLLGKEHTALYRYHGNVQGASQDAFCSVTVVSSAVHIGASICSMPNSAATASLAVCGRSLAVLILQSQQAYALSMPPRTVLTADIDAFWPACPAPLPGVVNLKR